MNKNKKIILFDDVFSNEEVNEIIMNILSMKINIYKVKNYSALVHYGQDDKIAQKKIIEIKMEIEKLKELLYEAKTNKKKLLINSVSNISLTDD